jgi:hypothetical protein
VGVDSGADGMILKFTKDGKFVMMIGAPTTGADSNNKDSGRTAPPLFFLPADITVDPRTTACTSPTATAIDA